MIASLVPGGARLADVGSDHGWLPISLLEQGRISYAVATDIRSGPLQRAISHSSERGIKNMDCVLCDGLTGVEPHTVDCVVIAGMGGDSISAILAAAPWACESCTIILQPMSKPETLRRNLAALGLATVSEHLVEDSHRIYSILVCQCGTPLKYSEAEYLLGPYTMLKEDRLFPAKLEQLIGQLSDALAGLSLSSREDDRVRAKGLSSILAELTEKKGALK